MDKIKKTFAELRRAAKETAGTRWSRRELAKITLLRGAHQETIAPLLRDCPVQVLENGEVLLRAGETCPSLFMLLSGRLRMDNSASSIPDTFIRAGDSVGELFLLEKAIVTSTISAAEPTRLMAIDRDTAWKLIRASHEIAHNWLSLFAQRTRASGAIAGGEEFKTSHTDNAMHAEGSGLHNRQWLEAMLPRYIARSVTSNEPLGLLLVEIDGFADHVVRFGDATGDRACKLVAHTIVLSVRPTDLVIGYGTGQFAVVLLNADAMGVCIVGERVRKAVSTAGTDFTDLSAPHSVTVSIGASEYKHSTAADALLASAEAALQMAKTSGGNRVGMQ